MFILLHQTAESTTSSSDDDLVIVGLQKAKKKNRCPWIQPMVSLREKLVGSTSCSRSSNLTVFVGQFEGLFHQLVLHLQREKTNHWERIDAQQQLATCLRSGGNTQTRAVAARNLMWYSSTYQHYYFNWSDVKLLDYLPLQIINKNSEAGKKRKTKICFCTLRKFTACVEGCMGVRTFTSLAVSEGKEIEMGKRTHLDGCDFGSEAPLKSLRLLL